MKSKKRKNVKTVNMKKISGVGMPGGKQKTDDSVSEKKRESAKNKKRITPSVAVISIVSFLVVAALVVGFIAFYNAEKDFDYLESDISEYISISDSDYKNYSISIALDKVGDKDVERKIMALLYQNRSEEPTDKGAEKFRVPVSIGDTVYIYYRGYTVDGNGYEQEIAGADNMLSDYATLGIGSLSFVSGFEEGLIGAVPWDHRLNAEQDIIKSGYVEAGDIIYMSYAAMYPDGSSGESKSARIDLSDPNTDNRYGEGFVDYMLGKSAPPSAKAEQKMIGVLNTTPVAFPHNNGTAVYSNMKVEQVIRCDNDPLTIDARFPSDYKEVSLRGQSVKFDVYFKSSVVYDAPEYNEAFITETLGITSEDLAEYAGDTVVEKHRAMLLSEAEEENAERRKTLVEEAVWAHLHEKVKVNDLPESEVSSVYYDTYDELYSQYQTYYTSYYSTFDEFAVAYYGLGTGGNWQARITSIAEEVIIEKLLFYYIIREENLIPSDTEFELMYNATVDEYLDYYTGNIYDTELDAITDEGKKAERIAEIKKEMMDYYGEEYFEELVYYDFALEKIIDFATVVEKQ